MPGTRLHRRATATLVAGALVAAIVSVGLATAAPGDLDSSFDSDGVVVASPGSGGNSSAAALVRLPDGSLQVAGRAADGGATKVMLARFTEAGGADPGFNSGTPVLTAIGDGGGAQAQSLARDGAGRLVVAGFARDGGVVKLFVARFTSSGALDSSFSPDGSPAGVVLLEPKARPTDVTAPGLALDSVGRIVVAGSVVGQTGGRSAFVARLTQAGAPDGSFGTGQPGIALPPITAVTEWRADDVAIDVADRPVIAGSGQATGSGRLLVARLTTAGALDGGFNSNGFVLTALGNGGDPHALALELVGGKPTVAGSALDGGVRKLALARFTDAGALDRGFNGSGTELEALGSGGQATARGIAVAADGKLVVAGSALHGGEQKLLVARLGGNGGLDGSFGTGGVALTPAGSANALALQPDAKVVAAGERTIPGGPSSTLLARYLAAPEPPPPPPASGPGRPGSAPTEEGPPPPLGPSAVTFGEPALFSAPPTARRIVSHRWELDGNGDFETEAGARVRHAFKKAGKVTVGLRTLDSAGRQREYSQQVTVDQPLLAQLLWSPVNPRPGQKVTFKLANIHGSHTPVSYFSWDFGGLKPIKTRLALPVRGESKRRGRGARAAAPKLGTQVLVSKDTDLSAGNTFTREFPKAGVFPVEARAVTADGVAVTTQADLSVGTKAAQVAPGADDVSATECAEDDDLACPQITVSGHQLQGFPITFSSQTPESEGDCTPLVAGPNVENPLQHKLDLGYPPQIPELGDVTGGPQGIGGAAHRPARAGAAAVTGRAAGGPCLEELKGKLHKVGSSKATVTPVQWSFGDGTKAPASFDPDGKAPEVLTHTYAKKGVFKVSLTARVTKVNNTKPGSTKGPGAQASKSFTTTYFVKKTITLVVPATHCGPLKLNGIPVTTTDHCFIRTDPVDPSDFTQARASKSVCCSVYRPFAGDHLIVGGLPVDARSDLIEPLVHPSDDKITAIGTDPGGFESGLSSTFVWGPGGYEDGGLPDLLQLTPVYPGHTLSIPKPKHIPELGQSAVDLPFGPFTGTQGLTSPVSNEVAGLEVKGGHFYLFPNKPVLARLTLKLPDVFTGTGEVAFNQHNASASANDDSDFSMELPAASIGPFETEGVTIHHRKLALGGGWYGGGTIKLFGAGLDAPHIPPGQSSAVCGKGGPSGFSLTESGSFEYGGATLKLPTDLPIVPPWVGFNCLQVAGTKQPFTLQGKVGLHVPVNGVIGVSACFLIAILEGGDTASGCGANNYTAQQAETWFRAAGAVTLFDDWELASAYFDLHKGNDLFKVAVGGGFDWDLAIVSISASVEGLVWFQPKFAFQFYGKGEICLLIICPNLQALVSSKGVAGCAAIAGFEYNWQTGSGEIFGGCDLTDTSVYISRHLPLPLAALRAGGAAPAPLGATTRTQVRVPKGRRAISFEVAGSGGAPRIAVTDPRGRRYVDDGKPVQTDGKAAFLHVEKARKTILTVRGRPPGGRWTIEAQPGSPSISGLATRRDAPQTRVLARVRSRGAKRRLVYRVNPVPGQRVVFLEEGRTVGRQIGVANGRRGSLPFPKGYGTAGKRRVIAVVEQGGMPRRRIAVTSYVAPKPPRVPAPRLVRASVRRGGLQVRWRGVRGAAGYRLVARLGDGRVLKRTVRKASTRIPFYDPRLSARVSVTAVARDERTSRAARLKVKPKRTRRIVVRL